MGWVSGGLLPLLAALASALASAQRIQPLDGKNTTSITVYNWGQLLHHVNAGPQTPPGWSHPLLYPNPARPYDRAKYPSPVGTELAQHKGCTLLLPAKLGSHPNSNQGVVRSSLSLCSRQPARFPLRLDGHSKGAPAA